MTKLFSYGRSLGLTLALSAGLAITPCLAQPEEVAPIETHEGRVIGSPEQLAPPRSVPLEESLPSVTEPRAQENLLRLDLR